MHDPDNWLVTPDGKVAAGATVYFYNKDQWEAWVTINEGKYGLSIIAMRDFKPGEPVVLYGPAVGGARWELRA